jgi:hypothetical protein
VGIDFLAEQKLDGFKPSSSGSQVRAKGIPACRSARVDQGRQTGVCALGLPSKMPDGATRKVALHISVAGGFPFF